MSQRDSQPVATFVVFAIMVILIMSLLSGCSTVVPVTARFPEPPGKGAMTRCPDLQKLNDGAKLSDVSKTITINYGTYYECAVKADAWQEWYEIQKRIFESVK